MVHTRRLSIASGAASGTCHMGAGAPVVRMGSGMQLDGFTPSGRQPNGTDLIIAALFMMLLAVTASLPSLQVRPRPEQQSSDRGKHQQMRMHAEACETYRKSVGITP